MASSLRTKLRIAASVLLAPGFFDAVAGRFLLQPAAAPPADPSPDTGNTWPWRDLAGALHVHSTYSDGAGDVPTVMDGAREAGIDFVLLCDHNTQQPKRDGWEERYQNQTPFLLVGTEVTVENGVFLLALDMPGAWEPTRDQKPQTAIDEIRAGGGLPLVSLPFDIKHPWQDWDTTGYEGLEVINVSTLARRHINLLSLAWLLPLNKQRGTMAVLRALLTRPDAALARWDGLMDGGKRQMIGLCALDAHALMKVGKTKRPLPSYADSFRTATTHVLLSPSDAADSARRGQAVYDALRAARCYMVYDCLGDPTDQVSFTATNGVDCAVMGEKIAQSSRDGVKLRAVIGSPTEGRRVLVRLLHNGKIVAAGSGGSLTYTATLPGAYRVEAYRYGLRAGPLYLNARPWIFTNPIYVS